MIGRTGYGVSISTARPSASRVTMVALGTPPAYHHSRRTLQKGLSGDVEGDFVDRRVRASRPRTMICQAMLRPIHCAILLALVTAVPPTAVTAAQLADATDASAVDERASRSLRVRLAATLTRFAREVLGTEPLSVQGLSAGTSFLIDATTLDPAAEESWRLLLDIAILTEREDLIERALPAIVRLAPGDTTARLKRLWLAIDKARTLESKSTLIERFVSDTNRDSIGPVVASRLALRLAMLHRRAGNMDRFGKWLDRAIAWDPVYVDALGIYTGTQQHLEQNDPAAWASQLLGLYRANPTDSATAAELGLLMLEHGAYRAAARMLQLASDIERKAGHDTGTDLDADLAMAWWAVGENDLAIRLLEQRQRRLNQLFQRIAAEESGGRSSTLEVAQLTAPVTPKMAAFQAMIATDSADPTVLTDAIGEAIRSAGHLDQLRETDQVPPSARAANLKRLLWLLLAVDAAPGSIEDTAHRIASIQPLDADEQTLIDVLTKPNTDPAEIRPLAEKFKLARLKLAQMLASQGDQHGAAMELLTIWRQSPGTLMGMFAGHKLAQVLGTDELPMSETAAAMSQVIDTLPTVFNRFPDEPSLAVSLRVTPRSRVVPVYDPVTIDLQITNHTAEPLTVGPTGPILDLLLIQPKVSVPYHDMQPGPPILIDVGRGLQLPPHGQLEFSIDLRSTWIGTALDSMPLNGAVVEVDAVLNVRVATASTSMMPSPVPGPLGSEYATGEMRVDGQRITDAWITSTLERLRGSSSSKDVVDVALLTNVVSRQDALEGGSRITPQQAGEIAASLTEMWPRLGPLSQAWLVSAMPRVDRLKALWSLVESSTEPLVKRVALMRVVGEFGNPARALGDPAVAAGLRSPDRPVRLLAEWIEATLQLQAESKFGTDIDAIGEP